MIVSYPIITWSSHGRRKPNRNLIVYNKKKRCWNLWAPETHTLWPTFSPPFKKQKNRSRCDDIWRLEKEEEEERAGLHSRHFVCLFQQMRSHFYGDTHKKKEEKSVSFAFTRDKKDKIGTLSFHVRVAWESQKPLNSSVNCHPLGWKFFPSAPNFVRWVPLCLFVELLSCLNKIWRAESRWQ